jgi:hypothetical protein
LGGHEAPIGGPPEPIIDLIHEAGGRVYRLQAATCRPCRLKPVQQTPLHRIADAPGRRTQEPAALDAAGGV